MKFNKTYKWKWGEFSTHFSTPSLILTLDGYFDRKSSLHLCLGWGNLFLKLPINIKYDGYEPPEYGIQIHDSKIWLHFGLKYKTIFFPWYMDWYRTSIYLKDNTREDETRKNKKQFWDEKWEDITYYESYPFKYILNNGNEQNVTAKVTLKEYEHRPYWFMWTKLFNRIRRCIEIKFSEEIGEGVGSWKGGTLSFHCPILPNESLHECLLRIEREYKFR
jgi:hypothetical protein